jgi:uncharacterized protein YabE (DUF348 family)
MKVPTVFYRLNPFHASVYGSYICLALFAAVLLATAGIYRTSRAADMLLVQISVEGEEKIVATKAATVGEVLDQEDIQVGELDVVEPTRSTPLSDAFNINIYRARPVMVVDGARRITITTALRSSHLVAKAAGLTVYPEDTFEETLVSDYLDQKFMGEQITIHRSKAVTVYVDGDRLRMRTQAATVSEFFSEKGIVLEESDFANHSLSTPITEGIDIRITRVGYKVVTEKQEVSFTTRIIKNYDLPYGEEKVEEPGKPGEIIVSYRITRHNAKIVRKRLLSKTIVSKPVERVVIHGMKPVTTYTSNAQILAALRQCETGGNYQTNTGNGYYGAYQFMPSTWDRIASRYRPSLVGVSPHQAKPADQDYLVLQNARASAGGFQSQHPGCYYKLGLPKFPL